MARNIKIPSKPQGHTARKVYRIVFNTPVFDGILTRIALAFRLGRSTPCCQHTGTRRQGEGEPGVSTKAEAGFSSEAVVIEELARQAQPLKHGESLLKTPLRGPVPEKEAKARP